MENVCLYCREIEEKNEFNGDEDTGDVPPGRNISPHWPPRLEAQVSMQSKQYAIQTVCHPKSMQAQRL